MTSLEDVKNGLRGLISLMSSVNEDDLEAPVQQFQSGRLSGLKSALELLESNDIEDEEKT